MRLLNSYMEKNEMPVIELEGSMLTEENAHDYLKKMLHFPEYYGKNMDVALLVLHLVFPLLVLRS